MDFFQRNFGFSSFRFDIILMLLYMATSATDDVLRLDPTRSSPTSVQGPDSHLPPDDPTSASYIPRAARMTPTSTTVHSMFIKKLSYPLSSRPAELWIVERTLDGIETWKPVETFLENMHLTSDRATLRTTANHWRQYYDVPIQSSSSSTATSVPVLPHPPNTPTFTFLNRMKRYPTSFTFYNHAGDVRLNTIHKALPPLYLGHHGDLHHLPHHRQHFTGPYIPITLPHLLTIHIVHLLRTNLTLWICPTLVCNTPHYFAE